MAEQPAYTRVLETAEFLELILFHLPMQDLLVTAQLVSRTWKAAVDSSPTLQAALFFRPLPTTAVRNPDDNQADPPITFNPLLKKVFTPWFRADRKVHRGGGPKVMKTMSWTSDPSTRNAVLRSTATWRRMFPTQPPKTSLELLGKKCINSGYYEVNGFLNRPLPEGIKMGLLYDLGYTAMRVHYSGFAIDWAPSPVPVQEGTGTGTQHVSKRIVMNTDHYSKLHEQSILLGDEWKSEAHEEVFLRVREVQNGMRWYGAFGRGPYYAYEGGVKWRLRGAAEADKYPADEVLVGTALRLPLGGPGEVPALTAISGGGDGRIVHWRGVSTCACGSTHCNNNYSRARVNG